MTPQCQYALTGRKCAMEAEYELQRKSGEKVQYCAMHAQQLREFKVVVAEARLKRG